MNVLIAGIGNSFCGDDAAGPAAARLLRERLHGSVSVIEEPGELTSLIDAWQGAALVIIIDATSSGSPAGTIHRLDATMLRRSTGIFRTSTHIIGILDVIEIARSLGRLPAALVLYGIEGKSFQTGDRFSPEVENAIHDLVTRVEDEIDAFN
jgi:hydrogenase maturation protease